MASSENVSLICICDHVKRHPNQSFHINLDASSYNALIKPLIECLKFSPLMKALTMSVDVPLVYLSKAFSNVIYNKSEEVIYVEVSSHKTSITKANFYKLLGLVTSNISFDPNSIPATSLIKMFFLMGYTEVDRKGFWVLTVRASSFIPRSTALLHHKVPQMKNSLIAEIPTLRTTKFVMSDPKNFEFVGSILEVLLKRVSLDNVIIRAYQKFPSFGVCPIPAELKKVVDEGDKTK
ncbi:unnamed protein product [Lactuca saligna]|uniref:Uncharacterized protein n=1 Tax=Lactuca saligna TaxID=75948 RepID=A0AA35ZL52_LACSI|nr:unnamed protein product [Lactuca saligna]